MIEEQALGRDAAVVHFPAAGGDGERAGDADDPQAGCPIPAAPSDSGENESGIIKTLAPTFSPSLVIWWTWQAGVQAAQAAPRGVSLAWQCPSAGSGHTGGDEDDPLLGGEEFLPVGAVHNLCADQVKVVFDFLPPGEDVILPAAVAGMGAGEEFVHIGGVVTEGFPAGSSEPVCKGGDGGEFGLFLLQKACQRRMRRTSSLKSPVDSSNSASFSISGRVRGRFC